MENKICIKKLLVGTYQVNSYLVICLVTKKAVIIDPGGDVEKIKVAVAAEQAIPQFILNTHGHADHVLANGDLKTFFNIPVCMHKEDDLFFAKKEIREISEKEFGLPAPDRVDIQLNDGQILKVGELRIRVLHTPGHTPGSVCFLVEGNLFTGDTLFVGDVGRTDLTGGSLNILLESLGKLIKLPPETIVWPGHDYGETPTSTIAWEMVENPYITDFLLA